MRRKSKVSFPVSIGAASLLVAFLVLCIATFARTDAFGCEER